MIKKISIVFILTLCINIIDAQKPKTWIITDGTRETLFFENEKGHLGDPDDISALAGYLLMSNMFDTRGIVVASTHHKEQKHTPDQKQWADSFFGKAYAQDLPFLNKNIGGYQDKMEYMQSSIKETGEVYNQDNTYKSLKGYASVQALMDEIEHTDDVLNVLCWGTLTEPAILVNHCLATNRLDILDKVRFISHWTNSSFRVGTIEQSEHVHNCFNDADGCAYIKQMALNGHIKFYECSGIGQYGVVEGGQKGKAYYNQFKGSALGKIFAEGKYVKWKDTVDDSDCASYWVLLGDWGVSLNDIASNGTNLPEVEQTNEAAFFKNAAVMRNELLRRAKAAEQN